MKLPKSFTTWSLLGEIYSIMSGCGECSETKQSQKRPEGTEVESDQKRVAVGLFETMLRGGH